jgi:hypothetical protein
LIIGGFVSAAPRALPENQGKVLGLILYIAPVACLYWLVPVQLSTGGQDHKEVQQPFPPPHAVADSISFGKRLER